MRANLVEVRLVERVPDIAVRIARTCRAALPVLVALLLAATCTQAAAAPARPSTAAKAPSPWDWSASAQGWAQANGVLPSALVAAGPTATISRSQFLGSLARIEELRGSAVQGRGLRDLTTPAPALPDAAADSLEARAVTLGWMPPRKGRFDGTSPITANEAALAVAGVLGLRADVATFAARLRTEVPGSRATLYNSAHAIVRSLGMRWNVKDPNDELELGPTEAVNVAHGAYMLHVAGARLDSWRLDGVHEMVASFDLPTLGPNQARILATAVRQLGQPYVWAGETEGSQAEGHGGFDCSGFTIRVINGSGVAAGEIGVIDERTTYTQSALPRARRIAMTKLQPADAMFFGDAGPRSTPTQNYHAGVYLGNGWFIHSSGGNGGVAIDSLGGWWGQEFSWGRRALKRP